ncbi:Mitochondrial inner membrane i-AAA protease complex subunit [Komagataella phaffii CBS 7435]|uniref:AAA+ ATPase domain-containing protein n=2 Tax=Komagataella phaffii TaxID=460519 RepID=C4R984_KOMPG|nr:uncharacterized protein PAS_chr4_0889 [Komagataella phaffii GS115]AOA65079.1 GQ67_05349T0 [Komagataella phaffii]CAH2450378.1 Mitochondrial inner membrane i-AAA protease complex subunit [Komagataella phaffii CBS 7435]AOA69808.1 GQ68_05264T1 [Komagataella phaffii GS115]AOA69809.1 GQ68_05264T0 [Komagataella phaffii GS115]AOA69810.1 GQ68_05264T2 [Komagataella phaffii GS115]
MFRKVSQTGRKSLRTLVSNFHLNVNRSPLVFHSSVSQCLRSLRGCRTYSSQASELPYSIAQLSAKEQTANRELKNPLKQAEFYKMLLQSDYPHVVISRYETPGIATSPECLQLYISALLKMGNTEKAARLSHLLDGSTPTVSSAFAGGHNSPREPLYVRITESPWMMASKWIKYLISIGLLTYAALEIATFFEEEGPFFKSTASSTKIQPVEGTTVRFDDVCGVDEARAELEEIVEFLKDPQKFTNLGGKLPKGVLLTGPPGTGKTLLARATAGEAGVPFFFMSGSEFDELYVGVGAKRVRELFADARAKSPAIIFIDELDAIGGKRNPKDQAHAKQTLNQLLVELDGFSQTEGIIIIGATNFPESLDKALTRPGRFDKIVNVSLPDVRGRIAILKHHMKNVQMSKDVDPSLIARGTPGFSGAELMNVVNQAAVYASQQNASAVNMQHLEWAKDKVLMGAARKTMVMTEESRRTTAYHEAGHAVAAMFTPGATPLYKATILPRGRALGVTFQLPEMDKNDITRKECYSRLDVAMGGRVAETMIYGPDNTTSGCSSDLQNATSVARAMVTQYGMSDQIGPIRLSDEWESWSSRIRDEADQEVRGLLRESEERARKLLQERSVELRRLAEGLLEFETLTRDEMEKVVRGESIDRLKVSTNKIIKAKPTKKELSLGEVSDEKLSVKVEV